MHRSLVDLRHGIVTAASRRRKAVALFGRSLRAAGGYPGDMTRTTGRYEGADFADLVADGADIRKNPLMAEAPAPDLRIRLFGPPSATVGGAPVEVDTRKAIAILGYLAATGRRQSRDKLAALLWPDCSEDRAKAALRRTLSALRAGLKGGPLAATRHEVGLESGQTWSDVADFRGRLSAVDAHQHDKALCPSCEAQLEKAVDLYRGDFLEGFFLRDSPDFDDWQFLEAESLRKQLTQALDKLSDSLAARADFDRALELVERRRSLDPLDEATHRRLMLLHAWKGERSEAMRRYRDLVSILDAELGVQPLEETTALYGSIIQGDFAAEMPTPSPSPPPRPSARYPLVGRDSELASIISAYQEVEDEGRLIVIQGEAGIGKTRLAEELLAYTRTRGAAVVAARSREGESELAYGLAAELIKALFATGDLDAIPRPVSHELSRLLPELEREGDLEPLDEPSARTRFFEAILLFVRSALEGPAPGVLFVDDLQWTDSASLELLGYLIRRLRDLPVSFVLSWRTEEAAHLQHLTRVSDDSGRVRTLVLELDRLGVRQVTELVRATPLAHAVDDTLIERLLAETEGIPFFLTEYLSVLAQSGDEPWSLPEGIRSLLGARIESISDAGRQLLTTAAVIDRDFDFETAVRASGRSEMETVDALDELIRRGLMWQLPTVGDVPRYRFSHDRLRAFVYDEMSPARRRLLHRRVAEALSSAGRGDPVAVAGLIARHHRLAGNDAEAALAHADAGDHARALFANSEALAHYESALALGHPESSALHEAIGDLRLLRGDYTGAVAAYETSAASADRHGLLRIEHKLGEVHQRRGAWDLASSHLSVALQGWTKANDLSGAARTTADLSLTAYRAGQRAAAEEHARKAIELATRADDPSAVAQAENILGILANARGAPTEAAAHLEKSLQLAEALGDVSARIAALNNLALAARAAGDLERSIALTAEALQTCEQRGDRHREAALHNNLADLLHASGDSDAARAHLKTATQMFSEIGEDAGEMLPEVWKLIEW